MDWKDSSRLLILVGSLFAAGHANAQNGASVSPTFASDAPLELKITGPFELLASDEDGRPEYDATLEYEGPDGRNLSLDIEIRIRGKSRANPQVCSFPPISLDFYPRADADGTVFEGQNRLKLVTLCQRQDKYRDYLGEEFAIYRMLNALTDRSFRVRWANVEYVYTDREKDRTVIEPAFLIEADWEVASRLGMEVVEVRSLPVEALDSSHTALLGLFHYLIGNTDWSLLAAAAGEFCCHNGKVIGTADGPRFVLPYDFDNSGLINAEYAVPSDELPIDYVVQRYYRGFCLMNDELEGVIERLNGAHDQIMTTLDSEHIRERARNRAVKYLEISFETINKPKRLENQIYEECRKNDPE